MKFLRQVFIIKYVNKLFAILSILLGFSSLFVLESCSTSEVEAPQKSIVQYYNNGMLYLKNQEFEEASKSFESLALNYPYSAWAAKGLLLAGYSDYLDGACDRSLGPLNQFISLYPKNPQLPYAYYLKGICYYEGMTDIYNDQTMNTKAANALLNVVSLFPNTNFAEDARLKLDVVNNQLAGHDMYVGRYYERFQQYTSAINRYQDVIKNYATTPQVPEALYRLTESYYALGLYDESIRSVATLGFNYPHNVWYKKALTFVKKYNIKDKKNPKDTKQDQS